LNYLHQVIGVCHRDIKPQNLLVSSFQQWVLSDTSSALFYVLKVSFISAIFLLHAKVYPLDVPIDWTDVWIAQLLQFFLGQRVVNSF